MRLQICRLVFQRFQCDRCRCTAAYSATCNLADSSSVKTNQELHDIHRHKKKKTTHTAGRSYSLPGISEETKETNKPHGLKAQIIRFAQLKFRIVHSLHSLRYQRESTKTSVVQVDSKVTFHTITSSFSLVTSYESCLTRQYFTVDSR